MTTLADFTADYIKSKLLSRVSDTVDKRQGSIIYDTLAPTAEELAVYFSSLQEVQKQAYARTATGGFLDLIVAEVGIQRELATYAVKKAQFLDDSSNPLPIALSNIFSTISSDSPMNYEATAVYTDSNGNTMRGYYQLTCTIAGTSGNTYTGNIIPVTFVNKLATAVMTDLLTPAQDEEDDETLRARYFAKVSQTAFGGNIAQYREYFESIDGVGPAQIYPTPNNQGGYVNCSILDASYQRVSDEFKNTVQQKIDPTLIDATPVAKGLGLGTAPIGHKVTVMTPTNVTINIVADVALESGAVKSNVETLANAAFESLLLSLRKKWAISDKFNNYSLAVFNAKVLATLVGVTGVANVTAVTLNGAASDINLIQNATTQQIPVLGTVVLNVGS